MKVRIPQPRRTSVNLLKGTQILLTHEDKASSDANLIERLLDEFEAGDIDRQSLTNALTCLAFRSYQDGLARGSSEGFTKASNLLGIGPSKKQ